MISKTVFLSYAWKILVFLTAICLMWQYLLPQSYVVEAWNSNIMKPAKKIYQQAHAHIFGNDTVIPVGEPIRGGNNIMFIETSCLVRTDNVTNKVMSVRQTCSVESAARMNPQAQVYLLHSCPIEFSLEEPVTKLLEYHNIKFWKVTLQILMSGTPLQDWDYNSALEGSQWPLEHSSDVVRFILLWKYGGIYMDLDFVVIRSVASLEENFVCAESETDLGSSIIKMNFENTGHRLAEICVQQLAKDFRGDLWGYNGPERITQAILDLCRVNKISEVDPKKCNVTVHKPNVFFPVKYWEWRLLFSESDSKEVVKRSKDSFGVHIWNKMSSQEKVHLNSKQSYNTLAKEFCPLVYSTSGEFF